MAHDGYIKLYRQLMDNELWKDKPFTKGQAWVDLLMKANYKDQTCKIKGKTVTIRRGQLLRGTDTLASDWGWSRGKVVRFLKELERTGNGTAYGTPYGTLITIENYETFQAGRRANGTTDGTASETADGTQKKKNKKNKKNKEREYTHAPTFEEVCDYVKTQQYEMDPEAFFDYYEETGWLKKNGQPIRDWRASVRTWARREREFKAQSGQYGNGTKPEVEPKKYKEFRKEEYEKDDYNAEPMPDDMKKRIEALFGKSNRRKEE